MWRTLIYYKPKQIDLAIKLQDNYISQKKRISFLQRSMMILNMP